MDTTGRMPFAPTDGGSKGILRKSYQFNDQNVDFGAFLAFDRAVVVAVRR
jgi:hypothetical protein